MDIKKKKTNPVACFNKPTLSIVGLIKQGGHQPEVALVPE